jgi:hypothetical protein
MTNELEKRFFDTFGVEPKTYATWDSKETQIKNFDSWDEYPQITDRILLELMFLITGISTSFELRNIRNVTALKTAILEFFIKKYGSSQNRKILKQQVQALFKEGNNESR